MLRYNDTPVQEITAPFLQTAGVRLLMKREDMNHPLVCGNKWWKLKYNLLEAKRLQKDTLLTFGGAYSNHIHATAAAARECGLKSIGIIRGEEMRPLNATLQFARDCGMHLHYVSREEYRRKTGQEFTDKLRDKFGDFYLIPEGGSNALAVQGVKEFAGTLAAVTFDHLCVPVGTGGTMAGLIAGLQGQGTVIGFPALKGGEFLKDEIDRLLKSIPAGRHPEWHLETAYHHGGYGKVPKELLTFLKEFEQQQGFRLGPIYTGKMMTGIFDLVKQGKFQRGAAILAIHTGGLQGWSGIE